MLWIRGHSRHTTVVSCAMFWPRLGLLCGVWYLERWGTGIHRFQRRTSQHNTPRRSVSNAQAEGHQWGWVGAGRGGVG